jgi:TPR repeat protein
MSTKFLLSFVLLIMLSTVSLSAVSAKTPKWVPKIEELCNAGSLNACIILSQAYGTGRYKDHTIDKDEKKAKFFIDRSLQIGHQGCDGQQDMEKCYLLGKIYFEGRAVPRDIQKGMQYVNQACSNGYAEACKWLDVSGLGGGRSLY